MTKLERWIGNEVTSVFNPKASVIENLTKKTIKKYVKWLCKCRYEVSTCDVRVYTSEMRSALAKGHRMCLNWLLNYHMLKKCKSKFSVELNVIINVPIHFYTILNTRKIIKTVTFLKLINQLMKKKIRIPIWIAKIISTRIWLKEMHFWMVVLISRWLVIGCRKKWLKQGIQE